MNKSFKIFRKNFNALSLGILTTIFCSCFNSFNNNIKIKYTTISGKLIVDENIPINFLEEDFVQTNNKRTAFPTQPTGNDYLVQAVNTTNSSDTINAEISSNNGVYSYTISIPIPQDGSTKKYKIFAKLNNSSANTILYSESDEISVNFENSVISHDCILKPTQNSSGTFSLTVKVDSDTNISTAKVICGEYEYQGSKSGTSYTFTSSRSTPNGITNYVDSGIKQLIFYFYNSSEQVLYSFTESIAIFDNLTTNTWAQNGNEPWFNTTTGSDGKRTTECHITKEMVDNFKLKAFFVKNGGNDSNSGTFLNPVATISGAVAKMCDKNIDYTIYIMQTITGAQEIPDTVTSDDTGTYHAKTITICGLNGLNATGIPQDVLNGNNSSTVLTVKSVVPITIKNLMITEGKGNQGNASNDLKNGGGIFLAGGSTVSLTDGTLIQKNSASTGTGGGVFISENAKLLIYGKALIGASGDSQPDTTRNYARMGGGIANEGTLCIGYCEYTDATHYKKALIPDGYGIRRNQSAAGGGGIRTTSNVFMASGDLSYNQGTNGGAVAYSGSSSNSFEITGGRIIGNQASSNGGAIYFPAGNLKIKGCIFSQNDVLGTGLGGAIYAQAHIYMGRGAYIPSGTGNMNTIFFLNGMLYISEPLDIPAECTDGILAKVQIADMQYPTGTNTKQILLCQTGCGTTINQEFDKFDVIQPNNTSHYYINNSGYIANNFGPKATPSEVYDIVFNDGTAIAYEDNLKLAKRQIQNAIAVIYVIRTDLNDVGVTGERMIGVGLVQKRLAWCTSTAKAHDEFISGIFYNPDNNGSTNLSQIATFLGANNDTGTGSNSTVTVEQAADLYPAFYFGINYKDQSRSHNGDMYYSNVAGTAFETGWYLPASWELELLLNRDAELTAKINTIMELIHGMPFTKEFVDGELYGWWTSSMYTDEEHKTKAVIWIYSTSNDELIFSAKGKERGFITCAVRQFN